MEFSFCTSVPLTLITVPTLLDELELKEAESFIFFAEGSLVFPWEPENISASVRWRLTWVDATVTDFETVGWPLSSFTVVPREESKSSR